MSRTIILILTALVMPAGRAHEHLAVGAQTTTPGSPLLFVNQANYGGDFGFVFSLNPGDTNSPYFGFYYTDDLVFTALAATPDNGGPEPLHAAIGSHIDVEVQSVEGPAGATFGFWETAQDGVDSTNLTWSVPAGLTNGTNRIDISENNGSPGSDPYGHIHGRIYSVTLPGLYRVGFQFFDVSTNGPAGGPIQAPSPPFYLYFQAGVTLARIVNDTNSVSVIYAAPSNLGDTPTGPATQYQLQSAPRLGPTPQWQPLGDPVVGDDHLHTNSWPALGPALFFRLLSQ